MTLALTPPLLALFTQLVETACGLHYGPNERSLFESKLAAHVAEQGYETLLDYYYRLKYDDPDGDVLRALVRALVVHETYLFRELTSLEALCDHYLRPAIAERGRVRVWSAACSTGEEPVTLAILLAARGLLDRVEIIASDVSETAVQRARAGAFGRRALRDGHPEALAARYLVRAEGGLRAIDPVTEAVDFRVVNLFDAPTVTALGSFDAILCRNVLIYFRDGVVVKVIDQLSDRLVPGGALLVGVSESLLRFGTRLTCEERGGAFFYRNPS